MKSYITPGKSFYHLYAFRYSGLFKKLNTEGPAVDTRNFYDSGMKLIKSVLNNEVERFIENFSVLANNQKQTELFSEQFEGFFEFYQDFFKKLEITKIPVQDYLNNFDLIEWTERLSIYYKDLTDCIPNIHEDHPHMIIANKLATMKDIVAESTIKNLCNFQNKRLIRDLEELWTSSQPFYVFKKELLVALDQFNIDRKVAVNSGKSTPNKI